MQRFFLRAKLHRAVVTEADLTYEGSLTVDQDLLDAVGLSEHEQVQCANLMNGERFTTYLFSGKRGSGIVCANGAVARLVQPGDRLIVMAYGLYSEEELKTHEPRVAILDERNRITRLD
jgi:aspartate 1-decarboxylase